MKYFASVNEHRFEIEINDDHHVTVDGVHHEIDFQSLGNLALYSLLIGGHSYEAYIEQGDNEWRVLHRGNLYRVQVKDEHTHSLAQLSGISTTAQGGEIHLKSPMPGMVITVPAREGQAVEKNEILVILEAMKMQNEIKSPCDGVVTRVNVQPGETIEQNQLLVVISSSQSYE